MASTCYCVKAPGHCGEIDTPSGFCSICPIDPHDPKTIVFHDQATSYQIGGDHYKNNAIQPIDYIMANGLSFCEGNVVKYVSRWRNKGGVEDLKKARQYLDFLIEGEESK